jgi:peptidoglycan hydrolase CwlO-like protein
MKYNKHQQQKERNKKMTIVLNLLLIISTTIVIIVSFKFFANDLKSEINLLNDKIDKRDNKLNNINKNCELLKKEMLYHRENLDKIKKINQETKDTTTETFKKIEKLIDNNNKKNNI